MRPNTNIYIAHFLFIGLLTMLLTGCENSDNNDKDQQKPKIEIPILETTIAGNITQTTAISGGTITNDGGDTIIIKGVCWGTGQNPVANIDNKTTDGKGPGTFSSKITCLSPNTLYYLRAYATNSAGTGYGNSVSFSTKNSGITFNPDLTYDSIIDIDHNYYHIITIGTKIWMAENLRVAHYNNGDEIPNIDDGPTWFNLPIGYCCDYGNSQANSTIYGKLYNFYAVADVRNICPAGWHVASDGEWAALLSYLGGENIAGDKLVETGTAHWPCPNTGATNECGFTALAGGTRTGVTNDFYNIGIEADWWSSTEDATNNFAAWYRNMINDVSIVNRMNASKKMGMSVRCVKD
jgi:uncharacterized protein (TIGR02145 family)